LPKHRSECGQRGSVGEEVFQIPKHGDFFCPEVRDFDKNFGLNPVLINHREHGEPQRLARLRPAVYQISKPKII
jgi:hypothetical protein